MKKASILHIGLVLAALLAAVLALYTCFWRLPDSQFVEGKGRRESPT